MIAETRFMSTPTFISLDGKIKERVCIFRNMFIQYFSMGFLQEADF
jgi:hypothetical protein